MDKKLKKEIEEKLKKQKKALEQELSRFAKKDKDLKGDWDTNYPKIEEGVGGQSLESAADQVEAYANLLPIEHDMELRLQDINLALEKLKNNEYGKCEKCQKDINEERLKIYPEARFCVNCDKK